MPEDVGVEGPRASVKGADLVQCTWCAHTFPAADGRQCFQSGASESSLCFPRDLCSWRVSFVRHELPSGAFKSSETLGVFLHEVDAGVLP